MTIVLLAGWALACGWTDLRWRRLPNSLTLGAHLPALLLLVFAEQGALGASPQSCLLAWLTALLLTLPAYLVNWLGAGDVKFLAAIGLLAGLPALLFSYAIAGLLVAGAVLLWKMAERWQPSLSLVMARFNLALSPLPEMKGRMLPFGSLLAVGLLVVLLVHAVRPELLA